MDWALDKWGETLDVPHAISALPLLRAADFQHVAAKSLGVLQPSEREKFAVEQSFLIAWSHFDSFSERVCVIRSQTCRTILIRSALESSDLCASNGGPNVGIRPLGADLLGFERARLPKMLTKCHIFFGNSDISIVTRSAPSGQIPTVGPQFDAQRSELSNAYRTSAVRHA